MRIEYTGRHLDVPDAIRRLGDRKLRKLERVLPGITDVRWDPLESTCRHASLSIL